MRNTWTHLMVSDTFYFIVDDTVFCPKDDKPYCPLTFKLFKLFFWFTFSCYFIVIAFQSRIILIRFCVLLMWLQSCCIQIVPRIAYKPKLVFTLLNNTPAFIRFL